MGLLIELVSLGRVTRNWESAHTIVVCGKASNTITIQSSSLHLTVHSLLHQLATQLSGAVQVFKQIELNMRTSSALDNCSPRLETSSEETSVEYKLFYFGPSRIFLLILPFGFSQWLSHSLSAAGISQHDPSSIPYCSGGGGLGTKKKYFPVTMVPLVACNYWLSRKHQTCKQTLNC